MSVLGYGEVPPPGDADGSGDASPYPNTWRVYCGAHTHVSLVSDGDQGECGTEFLFTDDDPECPSEWVPCPVCGAECFVDRSDLSALDRGDADRLESPASPRSSALLPPSRALGRGSLHRVPFQGSPASPYPRQRP